MHEAELPFGTTMILERKEQWPTEAKLSSWDYLEDCKKIKRFLAGAGREHRGWEDSNPILQIPHRDTTSTSDEALIHSLAVVSFFWSWRPTERYILPSSTRSSWREMCALMLVGWMILVPSPSLLVSFSQMSALGCFNSHFQAPFQVLSVRPLSALVQLLLFAGLRLRLASLRHCNGHLW